MRQTRGEVAHHSQNLIAEVTPGLVKRSPRKRTIFGDRKSTPQRRVFHPDLIPWIRRRLLVEPEDTFHFQMELAFRFCFDEHRSHLRFSEFQFLHSFHSFTSLKRIMSISTSANDAVSSDVIEETIMACRGRDGSVRRSCTKEYSPVEFGQSVSCGSGDSSRFALHSVNSQAPVFSAAGGAGEGVRCR